MRLKTIYKALPTSTLILQKALKKDKYQESTIDRNLEESSDYRINILYNDVNYINIIYEFTCLCLLVHW